MLEKTVKVLCLSTFLFVLKEIFDEILCSDEWRIGPYFVCSVNGGRKYSLDDKFMGGMLQYVLFFFISLLILKDQYDRHFNPERKAIFIDNKENEYEKEFKHYPEKVPDQFLDPITYEWMKSPVVLYSGPGSVSASYDESTAKRLLASDYPNDPITHQPIIGVVKNLYLKQLIEQEVENRRAKMKALAEKNALHTQSLFSSHPLHPMVEKNDSSITFRK